MVNSDNLAQESNISITDVLNAVSTLKHNKSDGNKGEMSEHVIYACDDLSVHLSMLFSSLLVHGAVTDDFSVSTMVPIPKSKCITSSSNYRAITLSSIFAKLFDRILFHWIVTPTLLILHIYSLGLKRNIQLLCACAHFYLKKLWNITTLIVVLFIV